MSDFDEAAQESIKAVLANEAGVSSSAVVLTLVPASVLVTAKIFVASASAVESTTNTLASGALADEASLQAALTAQFQADGVPTANLAVADITQAPADTLAIASTGTSAASPGFFVGIAIGVVVIMIIATFVGLYAKKMRDSVKSTSTVIVGGRQAEPEKSELELPEQRA